MYVELKILYILFLSRPTWTPRCLSMATGSSGNSGSGGKRAGSAGKASPIPHTRLEEEGQFERLYTVGSKLGEGSFGIVREVIHKTTGERWACKAVNKDNSKEKVHCTLSL